MLSRALYLGGCVQTSPECSFIPLKQEQARHELQANVDRLQGILRRMMAELQDLTQGADLVSASGAHGCNFWVLCPPQWPAALCLNLCQPTLWINLDP